MVLLNKIAVVTGASAGIGRAIALAIAAKGAYVAVFARNQRRLDSLVEEIRQAGGKDAFAAVVDVADMQQLQAAGEAVERRWGSVDVWINNAMVTVFSPFEEMTAEEFRRVTEVTYLGTVNGTRVALQLMDNRNRGHIVQVGSALAYQPIPLQSAYCGAKHAVRGFTNSLRSELIHNESGINLSMVHLSAFNTPQFEWARTHLKNSPQPLPPIYQPEIAAAGVIAAIEKNRREVWVGFPSVKAIVASKFLPGLIERYLARKAYSGQMTDEPLQRSREGNLFESVDGDYSAHGRFDSRARQSSWQLWLTSHRSVVASIGAAIIAVILIAGLAF